MDFREILNKLDVIAHEAKKERQPLTVVDALQHVDNITFTPPEGSTVKTSVANNIKFAGKDVNDPKVKYELFVDELTRSPGRLLGEIAERILSKTDEMIELSMLIGRMSNEISSSSANSISILDKDQKALAMAVIKKALRDMDIARDPDQSKYDDDKEEMESVQSEDSEHDNMGFTDKQIKMAYGILNDPRYKRGNLTGAARAIEKIAKGLSKHPGVERAMKATQESVESEDLFQGRTDVTLSGDEFYEALGWIEETLDEAEYQGRKVKLNKPMRGDVKKFKVYVKNPKGNVVKVNFGDPDMKIKAYNPERRRSFRARHNCDNPGPKHKARYWSCKKW